VISSYRKEDVQHSTGQIQPDMQKTQCLPHETNRAETENISYNRNICSENSVGMKILHEYPYAVNIKVSYSKKSQIPLSCRQFSGFTDISIDYYNYRVI
jgi:hypothetical protein